LERFHSGRISVSQRVPDQFECGTRLVAISEGVHFVACLLACIKHVPCIISNVRLFLLHQKWKAFTGQVEVMSKALKKKDISAALLAHSDAVAALDEYLAKVDLQ
jgi:hypothetical protein